MQKKKCCVILFAFMYSTQSSFHAYFCCLFKFLCVTGICTGPLVAAVFRSQLSCRIITTTVTKGICSGWAIWPLFAIPKPLRSQYMQARWNLHPFLIFTYELMIPPVGWLWPSKYSTWCDQRWCIVLVGYWRWWLTQYDTWFHSLIAAPSWIGHKPTETYWPWWK